VHTTGKHTYSKSYFIRCDFFFFIYLFQHLLSSQGWWHDSYFTSIARFLWFGSSRNGIS